MFAGLLAASTVVHAASADSPQRYFGRDPHLWEVVVLSAAGDDVNAVSYEFVTERVRRQSVRVHAVVTRGEWTTAGDTVVFDSRHPSPADPWPLTAQHAVASVPVDVEVTDGRLAGLRNEAQWTAEAHAAVHASAIPTEALASAMALVDAPGLVADLARHFPGPPAMPTWEHSDRIAGLDVVRTESCAPSGARTVACTGTAVPTGDAPAKFFELRTETTFDFDRRGLVRMESRYNGTLVAATRAGVRDWPVSGVRQVVRR